MNNDLKTFQVPEEILSACAEEPIHIPGAIQSFGGLLVFDNDWNICQASLNIEDYLDIPLHQVVGSPAKTIMPAAIFEKIKEAFSDLAPGFRRWVLSQPAPHRPLAKLDAVVHHHDGCRFLELIERPEETISYESTLIGNDAINQLTRLASSNITVEKLAEEMAVRLRMLIGYDRVMVYRFDPHWNGQVVAEAKSEEMEPYRGLWYPATDIPEQARRLYMLNRVRLLADVSSEPVPLMPTANPTTGRPLDLSYSLLRSFSPVHREYLTNMGVRGTLVASIIQQEQLWGLIACHHQKPRCCPPHSLQWIDSCAQLLSTRVTLQREQARAQGVADLQLALSRLGDAILSSVTPPLEVISDQLGLQEALGATGIALVYRDQCHVRGKTPHPQRIHDLANWLESRDQPVFKTDSLEREEPSFADIAAEASGVMALAYPGTPQGWLLWFREEVTTTVRWAGDPRKLTSMGATGRLTPRQSFETWLERRTGCSLSWSDSEVFLVENVLRPFLYETLAKVWAKRAEELQPYHAIVLAQVTDAVLTLDNDGYFTFWNESAQKLFGLSAAEALGCRFDEVLHPADRDSAVKLWDEVSAGKVFADDFRYRKKDGTTVLIDGRIQQIYDARGHSIGVVGIYRDVTQQWRAERDLRLAQTIVSQAHDAIIVTNANCADPDGPTIIFVNPALEQLTGYSRKELAGKSPRILQGPETDRSVRAKIRESLKAGESIRAELVNYRKDGSRYWIEMHISPVRTRNGQVSHFVAIQRDVTERRRSELAIRESERFLRKVIDLVPDFIVVKDCEGRFLLANEAMAAAYGATVEGLLGKTDAEFHPIPEEVEAFLAADREVIASQHAKIAYEEQFTRPDGTKRWLLTTKVPLIEEDDTCTRLLAISRDVTDQKAAREAMETSERQYRLLANSIQDIIILTDHRGQCLYVSPSCQATLGYGPDDAIGTNCSEWLHPDDWPLIAPSTLRARGTSPTQFECRAKHRDGHYRWMEVLVSYIVGKRGRVEKAVCCIRDISMRKELESQVLQAQKLDGIGRLAGGVAHDFNNVLTVVNGYADLLVTELDGSPSQALAEQILNAGKRGADLTRQLLAFGRRQIFKIQSLDLNEVIASMRAMMQRLIGEDIEFLLDLGVDLPRIQADRSQVEQVIMNLVMNASDAMPQGGQLRVTTVVSDSIPATVNPTISYLRLTVSDTGHGIDDAARMRLFEPFFTTKPQGKGTGLGLATVYGIVKQLSGEVVVESELDRGSAFHVYFPCALNQSYSNDAVPALVLATSLAGSERILVAEDDEPLQQMVAGILRSAGYDVALAGSAEGAEEIFRNAAQRFHMLLTDIVMPRKNGRELAELLRSKDPKLKAAFMSGYSDDAVIRRGIEREKLEVLQKPFTPLELLEFVRRILDS